MRTITVGRDNSCDIVINDSRVSRIHANIFRNGDGYTYRDMSTNGTRINGVLVQRTDIFINPGDSVLLASSVPLPWEKVKNLFPEETLLNISNKGNFNNNRGLTQASNGEPDNLEKWNWGAFCFGWLWAVSNGIYWPLIAFIPFLGLVAYPVICIILGINGNRWAWEKRRWQSAEHFRRVQHNWALAALWIFLISFILSIMFVVIVILTNV